MSNVLRACANAVSRELRFFDRMQDARRPPFRTGHGRRKVDGGLKTFAARSWRARVIWSKSILETLYSHFQVSRKSPKPKCQTRP
jgi:hypothetical protein